ncbi:hypothetical protein CTAYLR_007764 [Chrysophaeum taylorii]|uniref:Kinesin motor domain-containing protein n=1 Tax=Chrysophaeum taylorii TaxID=2483200 RepID=A0AAD7UKH6_9STRA|nr:hypothetical protein CTAYLR_007764 [Chrysophaeum taylorii]
MVSLAEFLGEQPLTERHLRQEVLWAGTETDARQLLFEREAAKKNAGLLVASMNAYWRIATLSQGVGSGLRSLGADVVYAIADWAEGSGASDVARLALHERGPPPRRGARVYARIKPTGDVAAVERGPGGRVLLHDPRLTRSGRTLRVTHRHFDVDGVVDRDVDDVVDPLFRVLGNDEDGAPSQACLLLFGQTGTGKTYTLRQALGRLVATTSDARLQFVELAGERCRDLLADGAPVRVLATSDGETQFVGATRVDATDASSLDAALRRGLALRASQRTERNDESSRSHAVVRCERNGRCVFLIDCAGSERRWETMQTKDKAMARESAAINLSLMALKDCFRAAAEDRRLPFRSSTLTRILRPCFDPTRTRVAIVATLSPDVEDIIHSTHTLVLADLMRPPTHRKRYFDAATERLLDRFVSSASRAHPFDWSAEETRAWLLTTDSGKFAHVVLPPGTTGRDLLGFSAHRLADLFEGEARIARIEREGASWVVGADIHRDGIGAQLFAAIRREAFRFRDLSPPPAAAGDVRNYD